MLDGDLGQLPLLRARARRDSSGIGGDAFAAALSLGPAAKRFLWTAANAGGGPAAAGAWRYRRWDRPWSRRRSTTLTAASSRCA